MSSPQSTKVMKVSKLVGGEIQKVIDASNAKIRKPSKPAVPVQVKKLPSPTKNPQIIEEEPLQFDMDTESLACATPVNGADLRDHGAKLDSAVQLQILGSALLIASSPEVAKPMAAAIKAATADLDTTIEGELLEQPLYQQVCVEVLRDWINDTIHSLTLIPEKTLAFIFIMQYLATIHKEYIELIHSSVANMCSSPEFDEIPADLRAFCYKMESVILHINESL